jgi:hypothetical protein
MWNTVMALNYCISRNGHKRNLWLKLNKYLQCRWIEGDRYRSTCMMQGCRRWAEPECQLLVVIQRPQVHMLQCSAWLAGSRLRSLWGCDVEGAGDEPDEVLVRDAVVVLLPPLLLWPLPLGQAGVDPEAEAPGSFARLLYFSGSVTHPRRPE